MYSRFGATPLAFCADQLVPLLSLACPHFTHHSSVDFRKQDFEVKVLMDMDKGVVIPAGSGEEGD